MTLFDTVKSYRKKFFILGFLLLCFMIGFARRVIFS